MIATQIMEMIKGNGKFMKTITFWRNVYIWQQKHKNLSMVILLMAVLLCWWSRVQYGGIVSAIQALVKAIAKWIGDRKVYGREQTNRDAYNDWMKSDTIKNTNKRFDNWKDNVNIAGKIKKNYRNPDAKGKWDFGSMFMCWMCAAIGFMLLFAFIQTDNLPPRECTDVSWEIQNDPIGKHLLVAEHVKGRSDTLGQGEMMFLPAKNGKKCFVTVTCNQFLMLEFHVSGECSESYPDWSENEMISAWDAKFNAEAPKKSQTDEKNVSEEDAQSSELVSPSSGGFGKKHILGICLALGGIILLIGAAFGYVKWRSHREDEDGEHSNSGSSKDSSLLLTSALKSSTKLILSSTVENKSISIDISNSVDTDELPSEVEVESEVEDVSLEKSAPQPTSPQNQPIDEDRKSKSFSVLKSVSPQSSLSESKSNQVDTEIGRLMHHAGKKMSREQKRNLPDADNIESKSASKDLSSDKDDSKT
eukprot:509959_1